MLTGLLCLLVLVGAWLVVRVRAAATSGAPAGYEHEDGSRWLALAAVLLASYPLARLAPGLEARPQGFWGDMTSHARVAEEIARTGLPNGWIDSYTGGFPFGHHYPPLGWALLAGAIRLGVSAINAVTALCITAALAFVVALHVGLSRSGVRPAFAALGAILLCWVAPYNSFVGGYETYFTSGLVSQVLVMPICTSLVVATLTPRHGQHWQAPLLAWLSMAAHPQVTVAAVFVLCLAALASGRRSAIASSFWTAAYAGLAGASLYGQGIATLRIPFGWPPDLGWRQLGFRPERLSNWLLNGELLDLGRPSVMTSLLLATVLIISIGIRRAINRALLCAIAVSLAIAVSGRWLQSWGRFGEFLLSFLQPLRALSLVPPLAAAIVAVGLDEGAAKLAAAAAASGHARLRHGIPPAVAMLGLAIATCGLPARLRYTDGLLARQRDPLRCDENSQATAGYDHERIRSWLRGLSEGRLWYEPASPSPLETCFSLGGVDLFSAVPIGVAPAVGAHVGVLARAARFLNPTRPGSSSRAEALGISYLLMENADGPPPDGWLVRQRSGKVQLLEQHALPLGIGCVVRSWQGRPEQVRARLNAELANPDGADALLDPHRFTAIDYGSGDVVATGEPALDCDDSNARVLAVSAHAGDVSAQVESLSPVDVVFRFSAFPTWRVWIDGEAAPPPRLVAPGFFSVRMPSGRHVLTAQVSWLPHYGAIVLLAALATAGMAALRGRFRRIIDRATRRLG